MEYETNITHIETYITLNYLLCSRKDEKLKLHLPPIAIFIFRKIMKTKWPISFQLEIHRFQNVI